MAASKETSGSVQPDAVKEFQSSLSEIFSQHGLECYPFLVKWYNEKVDSPYQVPYHDDTVAFIILSIPQMWEKAFKPFMEGVKEVGTMVKDPIDECMASQFKKAKQKFAQYQIDIITDYDMHDRRPKILVQTAGHIAGAAYYYQRIDVKDDPWPKDKKILGISLHPKYGGWFAFRGAFVFKDVHCAELPRPEPAKLLNTDESIKDLLNTNWKDSSYRDVIPPEEKYSEEQKEYFDTAPKDRAKLLAKLFGLDDKTPLEESRGMGQ